MSETITKTADGVTIDPRIVAEIETSVRNARDLTARVKRAAAAEGAAKRQVDRIEHAWSTGDDSDEHNGSAFVTATAEVQRWQSVRDALATRLRRLPKPRTDWDLPVEVGTYLRPLYEVEHVTVTTRATTPDSIPTLVIVAGSKLAPEPSGEYKSGTLEVHLHGETRRLASAPSVEDIRAALPKRWDIRITRGDAKQQKDSTWRSVVRIDIDWAFTTAPAIADSEGVSAAGTLLADIALDRLVELGAKWGWKSGTKRDSRTVLSPALVREDGVQVRQVRIGLAPDFTINDGTGPATPAWGTVLPALAGSLVGEHIPGLGHIAEAKRSDTEVVKGWGIGLELTIHSRTEPATVVVVDTEVDTELAALEREYAAVLDPDDDVHGDDVDAEEPNAAEVVARVRQGGQRKRSGIVAS